MLVGLSVQFSLTVRDYGNDNEPAVNVCLCKTKLENAADR